jgi:hypothetical protein
MAFIIALVSSVAYAQDTIPLGKGNVALKIDYIGFTDGDLERADVENAAYVAVEGFYEIVRNLYLGAEVGYAHPEGSTFFGDTELTYVPIELNLKYALGLSPSVAADLGVGASTNYGEFKVKGPVSGETNDWMFGGQVFADVNYKSEGFFVGINAKYKFMDEFKDFNFNMNNWMVGGQAGVMF